MNNDTELRWRLRQLPRDVEPPRDLWPQIESRLDLPARRRPWLAGFALAASVTLAVALAWQLRVPTPEPEAATPRIALVQREADAMTLEYQAALREFAGAPMPQPLEPALATLDASALQIRAAIARDPDAVFLLDRLRSTYARRISLTQRAVTG
jgi:hypothetical protein